jgi:hypothetical protein
MNDFDDKELNVRDVEEGEENTCLSCVHFTSFMEEYDDALEPSDIGRCDHLLVDDDNVCIGYHSVCDGYEARRDEG